MKRIVGAKGWSTDTNTVAPYLADQRGLFIGECAMLVRPDNTKAVAEIVKVCVEADISIVPQGGNTRLVGAGISDSTAVLVSLGRMNKIRDVDLLDYTITAEAGCILADMQKAAATAGRLFPLSLGAEGSCQIGGNLSTNAGGVNVLCYGNTRELVLGLEVVLPDGRGWNGLKRLRKDNTGYDLKHLCIGGEGTLRIITAAVLKLSSKPEDVQTAFVALRDLDTAIEVLARARNGSGDWVTSFKLICHQPLASAIQFIEDVRNPLDRVYEEYALIELSGAQANSGMQEAMEKMLVDGFERGEIVEAGCTQSGAQRVDFWKIREANVEAQDREGGVTKAVYDIVVDLRGSFSAEHGVGQLKLAEISRYKDQLELDLIRKLKGVVDPDGIMNPGEML